MKKWLLLVLLAGSITEATHAQTQFSRYIITFRNKGSNPFSLSNPQQFLTQRAIDRRSRYNIPLDSTDLPVTPRYVDSVRLAGAVTILNVSKWLNSVTIQTTDQNALNKINSFPFVVSSSPIALRTNRDNDKLQKERNVRNMNTAKVNADFYNYGLSYNQVHIHNGEFLHNIGLRGQGMIMGVLDAGFFNYPNLKSFDSARLNEQILGTWDFVARESSVTEDHTHGMAVLSIMAANIPGQFVGTSPKASFYLFRTEDGASEYPIEEHNWVCGAERLDSLGGDLINSSLGYTTFDNPVFNHTYADMNGNTNMSSIGADLAAKKGILVVSSAGNDGNASWHYLSSPADGDSVLAVGAVSTAGAVAGFSSYGPSSDGQVKPDVASVGVATVIQSTANTITTGNGTSFAGPNMAGLTACLWQGFPEFNNMKIINALRQAGSIATAPNDRIGYGIPDVKHALMMLVKEFATSTATVNNCNAVISLTSKDVSSMKYELERKGPADMTYTKVAEKFGTGSVFGTRTVQFNDPLAGMQSGTVSYRVRLVIDTASTSFRADYIDSVNVNLSSPCPVTSSRILNLFPNPATGVVKVQVNTTTDISNLVITIVNSGGQLIGSIRKSKQSGVATFDIPIITLASGKYYVTVYDDDTKLATEELVKVH